MTQRYAFLFGCMLVGMSHLHLVAEGNSYTDWPRFALAMAGLAIACITYQSAHKETRE